MAVQQLGRDQARTLTDIIRGVSNVGGGIDEALQVVPGLGSATPATPVTKRKISAYDPTADYGLDSEMSGNIDIEGDNVTQSFGKDAGILGDMIGSIFQYQGPGSQSFQRELAQKPQFVKPQISQMTEKERREMEADERVGINDQLNALAASLRDSDDLGTAPTKINQTTTETTGTTTDGGSESSNANQAAQVEAAGTDDAGGKTDEPYNPYGEMLEKAMKDVAALRGKDPNAVTREEYMKEFAEATGVNISGEPDKSHALMAFGLALMQNKAGKGFDVSKMLGAVGEAGEKAMPAFQKAKEQARAERIAAGKYALGEVKADAAARASSLKAANARVDDLMKATIETQAKIDLEGLKHKNKVELKIAELEVKAAEDAQKGKYDYKNTKTIEDKGLPGFKTTVGIRQTDGQSVYILSLIHI